ncbi:MAG: histidinol-phosphatase HisJ family protein [Lachnospiraceae bacterium]|nr:histidinol-phosphatase HisJ family protein [Lachnospiraceae bacterium]
MKEKKTYRADYHVHTCYSDDSECPMEDMVKRAIALRLDEIAFTDHVDYGVKTDLNCDYAAYFKEIDALREKYRGQLVIRAGIEFGIQVQTVDLFQKDFEQYPFDFVILSNHQIDNQEFWDYSYQKGKTQQEYQEHYYEAIYEVVKRCKSYAVLGHLDMIKRYDQAGDYPDEKIMHYVDLILKQVIADGKGIELNTSSFKYGLKDLMPSRNILKRYRELGGTILTIGSDTHETVHLADHLDEVKRELIGLGYESFCTFERMKPIFHTLEVEGENG